MIALLMMGNLLTVLPNSVQAAGTVTINDTDSYAIGGYMQFGQTLELYQLDGNNPTTIKASVPITGIPGSNNALNGLAVSETENAFYAHDGFSDLYKISPTGEAQFVTKLEGVGGGNGIISNGKYYYASKEGSNYYLYAYDLTTGGFTKTVVSGYNPPDSSGALGGDLVIDSNGYMWFAPNLATTIAQMNPETGEVLRVIPITNSDGKPLEGGARGLSFLPNGQMLLNSGADPTNFTLFTLDPETLSTTYLGTVGDKLVYDLASRSTPVFEPNPPVLESKKTSTIQQKADGNTDADHPEVGDTLLYTIQTRNTVTDSLVKNLAITDTLPEGLAYVPGTLKVDGTAVSDAQGDDKGDFTDGKVSGQIGDVTDTEWHTVTFEVKVQPGQAGNTIKNTGTITGDNTDPPDPNNEIVVYPRNPVVESKKTSTIQQKADGNTDADHPEVGDTLLYTIQARNTIEDSKVTNLAISDTLPEGLEYVPGTLKVDGTAVSDAQGDDKGDFTDGKVTGQIGDVTDTEWHTVTFEVKVQPGQAGNTIKNTGTITGDNTDPPDPNNEIVVYPRNPVVESKKTSTIQQKADGNTDADHPEVGDTLLYTIQARNTIEDSKVTNLAISDTLPEGLEYVPGTLKVDGTAVSDAQGDDKGDFTDGKVSGQIGDVTDTEWHTVTFEVKVQPGQAGNTIKNTGTITGDNTDPPDPNNEIVVYPRNPVVESKKTSTIQQKADGNTDADHPEVGDTLLYTIQARNTIEDSKVTNLAISDTLPEGLEYVPGTLKVDGTAVSDAQGDDKGDFTDGKVSGQIGDVTDTEWHTVTFEVKVQPGQAGKTIENTGTITGDNTNPPDPHNEIVVYPRNPDLESKKTSSIQEKAEGNTADNPQVGDTLLYTIQTRNKVEDSLIENLVIADELPEGLEYVPGTLKVDGKSVSDAKDEDKGDVTDGKVSGQIGDVTDTEWHTVTFEVKVKAGQSGKTIENTGTITGDNTNPPDPHNEIVVDPRDPDTESKKTSSIQEKAEGNTDKDTPQVGDTLLYTIQTRNKVEDSLIQKLVIADELPEGLEYVPGTLKVDGKSVSEAKDEDKGDVTDGKVSGQIGDVTDTEWHTVTFEAKVKAGQAGKTIKNTGTITGDNTNPPDPTEEIVVDPKDPKVESKKTSSIQEKADGNTDKDNPQVGDTLLYTIQTRNTVEDSLIQKLVIADELPEGLEYVPGTLKVDGKSVSDAKDEDKGDVTDGKVTGQIGDVADTEWHTVTFEVKVKAGQSGKTIENTGTITGDNINPPDPHNEIVVYPRNPVVESKKTSSIQEKADGNTDKDHPEVGDTLLYTIQARNTIEDSKVTNLVIADELPEGLEYVPGTLKVDGKSVSEAKDEDKGDFTDGKVTGQIGDVTDTEWHTVTFEAKVKSGQAGKTIKNTGTITGDNTNPPDPHNEIVVDPREPGLESEKTAKNMKTGKDQYEAGDTVVYTIKTRNTTADSQVENLVISDELPEGLEYVSGTLKVDGKSVSDAKDKDKGDVTDGKVSGQFGDVTDTEWHTVTFQAKINSGYSGKTIKNVAVVKGGNVEKPDQPEKNITVEPKDPGKPSEPDQPNHPEKPSPSDPQDTAEGHELPDTATNMYNLLVVGLGLLLLGAVLWYMRRKRNV
ncbi:isopeptide-forming domain-containing fimbrial protein [Bacillus sp. z60-10]